MAFDFCTNGLGNSAGKICSRGREPVAANELNEPLLDAIVVEDC
jgi:hypothetical protein